MKIELVRRWFFISWVITTIVYFVGFLALPKLLGKVSDQDALEAATRLGSPVLTNHRSIWKLLLRNALLFQGRKIGDYFTESSYYRDWPNSSLPCHHSSNVLIPSDLRDLQATSQKSDMDSFLGRVSACHRILTWVVPFLGCLPVGFLLKGTPIPSLTANETGKPPAEPRKKRVRQNLGRLPNRNSG